MATATITDLQSLVNRLTADNNRLRNLVKLYGGYVRRHEARQVLRLLG